MASADPWGMFPTSLSNNAGMDEKLYNPLREAFQSANKNTPGIYSIGYQAPSAAPANDAGGIIPYPPSRPSDLGSNAGQAAPPSDRLPDSYEPQELNAPKPATPSAPGAFSLTSPSTWLPALLEIIKSLAANLAFILIAVVLVVAGLYTMTKANG